MDSELNVLQRLTASPQLMDDVAAATIGGLKLQSQLRTKYDPDLVRAALTLHELRSRAKNRFSNAGKMLFDRFELEQATPEPVARHKAQRFARHGTQVDDLYCGVGMNAIAFAQAGLKVLAMDPDAAVCFRTAWNADVYGQGQAIKVEQTSDPLASSTADLIHLQPVRSSLQQKSVRLEDHVPALEELQGVLNGNGSGGISLSPASNFGGKFGNCEIELISLNGDCKEAVIWFGALQGEYAMTATLLPQGVSLSGNPWESLGTVGPLETYLHDPDAAIVRAGLVDVLCEQMELNRLDDAEEYLTGPEAISSPFVTSYEIVADLPNNDREIRNYFRANQIGEVEIRCRHVPVNAASLRKKLPLQGKEKATLFIARLAGKTRVLVGRQVVKASE